MKLRVFTTMSNDISGINLSITLGPNEMRDLRPRLDKWDLTLREMMDDTASTGLVIKACKPWREANSKLFYEFLESIQAHTAEPQIFNTIADFIQYCEDTLHIMRGIFPFYLFIFLLLKLVSYL